MPSNLDDLSVAAWKAQLPKAPTPQAGEIPESGGAPPSLGAVPGTATSAGAVGPATAVTTKAPATDVYPGQGAVEAVTPLGNKSLGGTAVDAAVLGSTIKPVAKGARAVAGAVTGGAAPTIQKGIDTVADEIYSVAKKAPKGSMTTVEPYLKSFYKTVSPAIQGDLKNLVTNVASKVGVDTGNISLPDVFKLREELWSATKGLASNVREGLWDGISGAVRGAMNDTTEALDQSLGYGTKLSQLRSGAPIAAAAQKVLAPIATAPQAASKAPSVMGRFLTNRVKSMAGYGANRMMWELLDKAKGHLFGP